MAISNPGGNLNSVPAPIQQTLATNYLDLNSSTGWGQQYVPDLMEQEAEVFGPRTISGFLSQVGAEEAMTADQVIWSEQGRLHLSYKGNVSSAAGGTTPSGGAATSIVTIATDIDGNGDGTDHGIRVNDTVIVSDSVNGVVKCVVTRVTASNATIDVAPYLIANLATSVAGTSTILKTS